MILVVVLAALLSPSQDQPTSCADRATCVAMAQSAMAAKHYEQLHDLAWAAYRKGKSTDPELMLLLARAQSLSGRPLDALVMLERLAALGVTTDAATSDDFSRVRALARWPEVAAKLEAAASSKGAAPARNESKSAPSTKGSAPSPTESAPSTKAPAPSTKAPAPSPKAPLSFTTVLTPTAIAHDAVSQRFLIADRKARRIAVVDGNTGHVATLVGAQGGLGEIGGMTIDPREGDLWVASATDEGPMLHKLQLISGRVLSSVPLKLENPITAMTHVRRVGLVAADSNGVVWRVRADGSAEKLAALEYVPSGMAADDQGRLYISAGASRLARFSIGSGLRKVGTIEIDTSIPTGVPFVVVGGAVNFIVPADGDFELRKVRIK